MFLLRAGDSGAHALSLHWARAGNDDVWLPSY